MVRASKLHKFLSTVHSSSESRMALVMLASSGGQWLHKSQVPWSVNYRTRAKTNFWLKNLEWLLLLQCNPQPSFIEEYQLPDPPDSRVFVFLIPFPLHEIKSFLLLFLPKPKSPGLSSPWHARYQLPRLATSSDGLYSQRNSLRCEILVLHLHNTCVIEPWSATKTPR